MEKNLIAKYDFGFGLPPSDLFNEEDFKACFNKAFNRDIPNKKHRYYNYACHDLRGDFEAIEVVADFYSKEINCRVDKENIMFTYGASIGILLCTHVLLKHGDNILVEVPTYFACGELLNSFDLNLFPAKRDNKGNFNFEEIEQSFINNNIKAFYLVTNFSNPTGNNLSTKDRARLYELANKYKVYIFSDDIYELIYYDEKEREVPLFFCNSKVGNGDRSELMSFDNNSSPYIISINSFNKVVCPAFKFGFILAHKDIIDKISHSSIPAATDTLCSFSQFAVKNAIQLGFFNKWIEKQRSFIKKNMEMVVEKLSKCRYVDFIKPKGGYFLFVNFSKEVNVKKLFDEQKKYEFVIFPGSICVPNQFKKDITEYDNTARLCVSTLDFECEKEAIDKLIEYISLCLY